MESITPANEIWKLLYAPSNTNTPSGTDKRIYHRGRMGNSKDTGIHVVHAGSSQKEESKTIHAKVWHEVIDQTDANGPNMFTEIRIEMFWKPRTGISYEGN